MRGSQKKKEDGCEVMGSKDKPGSAEHSLDPADLLTFQFWCSRHLPEQRSWESCILTTGACQRGWPEDSGLICRCRQRTAVLVLASSLHTFFFFDGQSYPKTTMERNYGKYISCLVELYTVQRSHSNRTLSLSLLGWVINNAKLWRTSMLGFRSQKEMPVNWLLTLQTCL